jgi:hypothetical protein
MGKKIALLIGINYVGTPYNLSGCHNDVLKYKSILINNFGYKNEDIKMLLDLKDYEYPTKENIIKYMNWIYEQTAILNLIDEITLYYSGHGTNIRDTNGDEPDKMDECIVPLDFNKSGFVVDDYIYLNFLSKLKTVKKIIMIMDSCNSASCTDLPFSFTLNNNKIIKQFYSKRSMIKNNPNIFVLSGCLDPKYSFEAKEPDGTPCGLLSYWLRKTLEKYNYTCTIENLLISIKNGFGMNDQMPVLSVNSNNHVPSSIIFNNSLSNLKKNNNKNKGTSSFLWSKILKI